jgi:hypothetical protein
MALLNKELNLGYNFIRTHRPGTRGENKMTTSMEPPLVTMLRTWDDRDFYYCEIFQGDAFKIFPIESIIPEDILENIKTDDNTCLYICNTHEAFLDIIEPLYQSLVVDADIPARKIYISNEAPDLAKEVRKYADNNGFEYMNVEWVLEFEFAISIKANQLELEGKDILTKKQYDKRYLNFNRRWRPHRPALVALLKAKGLLEKGLVSLAPSDDGRDWNDHVWAWIKKHHEQDEEITELLKSIEHELPLPPMYLDTDELMNNRADFEDSSLYLYRDSLVSVVNETTFYHGWSPNESRFLSEKIFKPIAVGHPFIFVTVPKALEVLKTLGYKTFHPYIDESYDNEFDNNIRLKMILDEIEKICNMSEDEVEEFIDNVKKICVYNQQVLKAKTYPFIIGRDPKFRIVHSHYVRRML